MGPNFDIGAWVYNTTHKAPCKVIDQQILWEQSVCQVWLPNQNVVAQVPSSALRPLSNELNPSIEAGRITYLAAAAKVSQVLAGTAGDAGERLLLAPMESNVIPLPHQLQALSKAIYRDRIRYLLADEVGLGKTIEAGLIIRELKQRGLVRRTLVVAPKGVATQWVAEMQTHFNESFQLVLGEDVESLQRLANASREATSAWSLFDQIVVSQDSIKPVTKRRGWSADRTAAYNRSRFEDLIAADWDLVIVDEAHRLGGSTEYVARHRLGKGLAQAAPYLLLLSATPHQGKSDAFHRLMALLDKDAFLDEQSISRERVAPYVIRTEKRMAIDADGRPLFKPRRTQLVPVSWQRRHQLQQSLYEAVTDYVREGYNQALRDKKRHIGFLMVLMQRLVISSTRAIRSTLQRRLDALEQMRNGAELELAGDGSGFSAQFADGDWEDLDAQEQLDRLQDIRFAHEYESAEVRALLDTAIRCEEAGPDAKAEALIERIYQLQSEEHEPDLKVLLFTEFVPTQQMLCEFLEARGITAVRLNGSMDMAARQTAQDAFRDTHRVLVSTDAGGEGLNLQFAHVVINYDIPWNPMRLEQRIGRVDRIGQTKPVRALNFIFEESVEFRVREILEQKLAVIFDEFGIDKMGDVLDSVQAGELFEGMFATTITDPANIETAVDDTVSRVRGEILQIRDAPGIFGTSAKPDTKDTAQLRTHPLPYWVERMTLGYLRYHNGRADHKHSWWNIIWPDGHEQHKCVFNARDAARLAGATLLSLEDERVRGLATSLPRAVPGEIFPSVVVDGIPAHIAGYWGLFEVRLQSAIQESTQQLRLPHAERDAICVFASAQGKLFLPTARRIWDSLLTTDPEICSTLAPEESGKAYTSLLQAAEQAGQDVFTTLRHEHDAALAREEKRGEASFAARRRIVEKVGLPKVRQFRMARCDADQEQWRRELASARQVVPELQPLLLLHVANGDVQ